MLGYIFLKQKYVNYIKNNFFLDYRLKFLTITITYNMLINLAFFFAEKYIIEYYTRYVFNYTSIFYNKIALKLNQRDIIYYMLFSSINILLIIFY